MKSVLEWLTNEVTITKIDTTEDNQQYQCQVTILQRLAELIIVNYGSTTVKQWGNVQEGVGIYGRMGLTMPEAMELINFGGIYYGFLMCQDDDAVRAEAMKRIREEAERVKREGFDPFKGLKSGSKAARERSPTIEIFSEEDMKKVGEDKDAVEPQLRSGRKVTAEEQQKIIDRQRRRAAAKREEIA